MSTQHTTHTRGSVSVTESNMLGHYKKWSATIGHMDLTIVVSATSSTELVNL
jgi:hypothetical protein